MIQRKYYRYGQQYRESTTGTVNDTEKVLQVRSTIQRKYDREVAGKRKYDDRDQISPEW